MNIRAFSAPLLLLVLPVLAQTPPSAGLASAAFSWDAMPVSPTANGERRAVFDGSSALLRHVHCHISTLKPGASSGEPRLHPQEEVIVIREGQIEATFDGRTQRVGPGSVLFFAAGATTRLRNVGTVPATYTVISYSGPLAAAN